MNTVLLPAALAIIKVLGHSKLDSLEARVNHFADNSARNAAFKRTTSIQTSVMIQRDISPNDNLEKLAREAQKLASEKKKQNWKFNNCCFDKKRKLRFGPNNNPVLPDTVKFLLFTTIHSLNHLSTDKMTAFMNQYWWGNIRKATKSAYLTCPIVQSTIQGSCSCCSQTF